MKKIISINHPKPTLIGIMLLLILAQAFTNLLPLALSARVFATAQTAPPGALPDLFIKAINPGYTVDKVRDVGELIELQKNSAAEPFALAGYTLRYTNASGGVSTLISFADGAELTGEFLLLRLARTAESGGGADATYTTTIAMSDVKLELWLDDEIVDAVCWSKKPECAPAFDSDAPTTLVRDLTSGKFAPQAKYTPHYDATQPALRLPSAGANSPSSGASFGGADSTPRKTPENAGVSSPDAGASSENAPTNFASECRGLEFAEILTYYAETQAEQFIELYNSTGETITSTACKIRYKNKTYAFTATIAPNSFWVFYPAKMTPKFSLTKNPTTTNTIELLDANDAVLDKLVYEHGQKKSTALAKFYDARGAEFWEITYAPTPGQENLLQEFATCPAGKTINPATGNCVKITATAEAEASECPAGKYRNPLTGRCKTLETETAAKPCAEGYERNPETGRCRKVTKPNDGAAYPLLVPETRAEKTTFNALGIVMLLVALGVIYIILQFRRELARAVRKIRNLGFGHGIAIDHRKIRQRLHHIGKDLLARCRRFHRDK